MAHLIEETREGEKREITRRTVTLPGGIRLSIFDTKEGPNKGRQRVEISPVKDKDGETVFKKVGIITKQGDSEEGSRGVGHIYKNGGRHNYPDETRKLIIAESEKPPQDTDLVETKTVGNKTIETTTRQLGDGRYIKISKIVEGSGLGRKWAKVYLGPDSEHTITIDRNEEPVAEIKIGIEFGLVLEAGQPDHKKRRSPAGHKYMDVAYITMQMTE